MPEFNEFELDFNRDHGDYALVDDDEEVMDCPDTGPINRF